MKTYKYFALAFIMMSLSVAMGAFGAHWAEGNLLAKQIKTFKTGVTYHSLHSIILLILCLIQTSISKLSIKSAYFTHLLGILFFSGNCYLYALTGLKAFAMLVPIGGFLFIIGHLMLALQFFKLSKVTN